MSHRPQAMGRRLGTTGPAYGKRKQTVPRIIASGVSAMAIIVVAAAGAIAYIEMATKANAGDDDDANVLLGAIHLLRGGEFQRDEGSSAFFVRRSLIHHHDSGLIMATRVNANPPAVGEGVGEEDALNKVKYYILS